MRGGFLLDWEGACIPLAKVVLTVGLQPGL